MSAEEEMWEGWGRLTVARYAIWYLRKSNADLFSARGSPKGDSGRDAAKSPGDHSLGAHRLLG